MSPLSAFGQGSLTIANPHWNITLTDFGYSDFLLDNTPGFEGREFLSGEWGAAVGYEVSGGPNVKAQWLEPQFSYPTWTTNLCHTCGAPLLAGIDGICPRCLLLAGLSEKDSAGNVEAGKNRMPSVAERLEARIGRYKLLEEIGEGGFGIVWMAEQEEPVQRRLAPMGEPSRLASWTGRCGWSSANHRFVAGFCEATAARSALLRSARMGSDWPQWIGAGPSGFGMLAFPLAHPSVSIPTRHGTWIGSMISACQETGR